MTTLHSKDHTFLIGQEVTFGTAVTADKDVGLVQSVTPSDTRELIEVYASGSREIQEIVASKFKASFDYEINMQNGRPLEYLFGTVGHALTGSDTKHTFSVASTLPSFTTETSYNSGTDAVFKYDGCKMNSAVINLETNGILKMTPSVICQSVTSSASGASAAVVSSLKQLHYKHSTLSTGTAASETSVGNLQTFNLTVENNMVEVDSAGTFEVQELVASSFKMAFDFTMSFEDITEYDIFLGGSVPTLSPTEKSALFNANNGVTLGSGRREFEIQLDGFLYEEVGTPTSVGEIIVQSFKGTATALGSNGCFYVDNVAEAAFS